MILYWLKKLSLRLPRPFGWVIFGSVTILIVGTVGYRYAYAQPKVIYPTAPALGISSVSHTIPLEIVFSRPVNKAALRYEIHPSLRGRWKITVNPLTAKSYLRFTPTETLEPETRYTVELSGIGAVWGRTRTNYLLSFQTAAWPRVVSVSPTDGATDVLPETPLVITLDKPLGDGMAVTAVLSPAVTLDQPVISKNKITFSHSDQFQKSTAYTVKIAFTFTKTDYETNGTTSGEPQEISPSVFKTIAAPGIKSYAPTGENIDPVTTIRFEFEQTMDRPSTQEAVTLTPAVAGNFAWENDKILIFTPSAPLAKGQTYTVTLANTAKGANGVTTDAFSYTFSTIGLVRLSSSSPANGASGIDPNTAIKIVFNQEITAASAQNNFSIAPTVAGTFTAESNTIVFHPAAPLAFNTTYTVTIKKGVQSVRGLDSAADIVIKFTTRNQSVMLNVPAYRQVHVYSCMIAAARSALAYRGVAVSEASIISRVGIDPTKWSGTWGGDNGVWGDPETAIVGPLDNAAATSPSGKKTTNVYWGYGSHWGPISRAMTSFGVGNEVKTGMTVQDLANSIAAGNPVIVWWVNGIWPSYEVRWRTPSGKSIRGVNGLHVQVVRGFTGSADNPASFTVTDSGYGYPGRTIDIGTFKAKWRWFNNTGIIVK